jgi:next-to-BRCA1 protein 1
VATATPYLLYLSPTPTGTIFTPTTNAGSLAYGCNNMGFIRDEETPDGTVLRPNENFVRRWKVVNNGTCDWLYGFRLVPISGYQFAEDPVSVHGSPIVPPGEWREFAVNGQAPDDPGTYTQYWRLSDGAGHMFGATLSISIVVRSPTSTPNPTSTSTMTSTATVTPTLTEEPPQAP